MPRLQIEPFTQDHVDAAAKLLAARHRAHRSAEPGLDPRFEAPAAARAAIEMLGAADNASGSVAVRGATVAGYLLGAPRPDPRWGPNVWIEPAGHAVDDAELVRDLYAASAGRWVEEGRTDHYAVVPADPALVDAWFRLDFGQQHVHGIREAAPASFVPRIDASLTIRRAERDDIRALAAFQLILDVHQTGSPVFSQAGVQPLEEVVAETEQDFDDPRYSTFVAEHGARIVGAAVACSAAESSLHSGVARPPSAGFLAFAAVNEDARGLGVGRALGETVVAWSRDAGYAWVVADWRSTNLLASRAWTALDFRPFFRRLHRTIAR